MQKLPLLLCILDGWGLSSSCNTNAITSANTPNWDHLYNTYSSAYLEASENHVGLPNGQMGNSEVGHITIGSGRIVQQSLPYINEILAKGELKNNDPWQKFNAKCNIVHLMGLISDGGVHSHINQLLAIAEDLLQNGKEVRLHGFLDGRDCTPGTAHKFLETWEEKMPSIPIVTIAGRYYAMDRDNNWDRTEQAWQAMVNAKGLEFQGWRDAISAATSRKETDEFVTPSVCNPNISNRKIDSQHGIVCANFRVDRIRQIIASLSLPNFKHFSRINYEPPKASVSLTSVSNDLCKYCEPLFPPEYPKETIGEVLAKSNLKQLRIAETEKYAHVTYFFNGGVEKPFTCEDRILVPSPDVKTYDLQPEMSAAKVTDEIISSISNNDHDVIICNYANPDMVGHTGNLNVAIKAVEAIDASLGRIYKALQSTNGTMIITADHGNLEEMGTKTKPNTQHTTNPVPFVVVGTNHKVKINRGTLADIAPSMLTILGLPIPKEMTGKALI